MKLPDPIKWRAHNLFSLFVHRPRYRIIWQTYWTLRITSALLEWKNKKTSKKGTLHWPWFSNRSPTAGFHRDSLHTLLPLTHYFGFFFPFPINASILPSKFTQFCNCYSSHMQCLSKKLNCNALRAFQAFIVNARYKNMSTITQTM